MVMHNAQSLVGGLVDQDEANKRPQIKLPEVKRREAAGNKELLQLKHDVLLYSNVRKGLLLAAHYLFGKNYNALPDTSLSKVNVIRSYWLGKEGNLVKPFFNTAEEADEFISNRLVNDLVEIVSSYKLNFDRRPATQILTAREKKVLVSPQYYRDWFIETHKYTRFTLPVVEALANGKTVEKILDENLPPNTESFPIFGGLFHAPIIYKKELEKVSDLLLANPTPKEWLDKQTILADISRPVYQAVQAPISNDQSKEIEELKAMVANLTKKLDESQTPKKSTKSNKELEDV